MDIMRYLIRELYYLIICLQKKMRYRNLKIGFRAKTSADSWFEGYNKLEHHSYFSGEMGFASYIGDNSQIVGKIGRYCSIAGNVKVLAMTHPVRDYVSTSPCFYSLRKTNGFTYVNEQKFVEELSLKDSKYPVVIGNDVYIGFGVTIIAPVKIGDGAVVAANSVVTKDIEPYSVVAGNPAKTIRKRFDDDDIKELLNICWWDKDEKWIKDKAESFDDVKKFVECIKQEKL